MTPMDAASADASPGPSVGDSGLDVVDARADGMFDGHRPPGHTLLEPLPFECGSGGWSEQRVDVGELTLNVACWGEPTAPWVVMLHGYPELHLTWSDLAAPLVAAGYVVVAPDQRGYNHSDKPVEVEAYEARHLVADLQGLLTASGRRDLLLVGHDWGAVVAYLFAHAHPEQVRGLVTLNGPHPDIWGDAELDPVQAMASAGYVPLVAGPFSLLALPVMEQELSAHLSSDELSAYREAWHVPDAFPSMGRWFQANLYPEYRLPTGIDIRVPTLALWGLDDPYVTPSQLEHLPDFVEDLEVLRFEGVDHWITHQRTEEISRELLRFAAGLPDAP